MNPSKLKRAPLKSKALGEKGNAYYMIASLIICVIMLFINRADALTLNLPSSGNDVVGEVFRVKAGNGDDFFTLGQEYNVGFYELVEANRRLNPDTISTGTVVTIPRQFILPNVPRKGIVINLAEMRLYYYPKGQNVVKTYPIGIGRRGWETPKGVMTIIQKQKNPVWRVPKSIREHNAEMGQPLPKVVPPGPDNPLGKRAIRLSNHTYLIHGTNSYQERGIGMRVSSGCIRMYNEDIENLFSEVPMGTQVRIIDEPYKLGWNGNSLLLEVHEPLKEFEDEHGLSLDPLMDKLKEFKAKGFVNLNWDAAISYGQTQNGIPHTIGHKFGLFHVENTN